jgi:hypothetical protein
MTTFEYAPSYRMTCSRGWGDVHHNSRQKNLRIHRRHPSASPVPWLDAGHIGDHLRRLVQLQPFQAHQREQEVAGQPLEPVAVVRRHRHGGVYRGA